jgi:hypothetical protein
VPAARGRAPPACPIPRSACATLADVADIERWFARRRARSCGEKRRYASEREARDAAYLIRMQTGERLAPYECFFCRCWHLGHAGDEPPRSA